MSMAAQRSGFQVVYVHGFIGGEEQGVRRQHIEERGWDTLKGPDGFASVTDYSNGIIHTDVDVLTQAIDQGDFTKTVHRHGGPHLPIVLVVGAPHHRYEKVGHVSN